MLTIYWEVKDAGHKILYQFNSNDAYNIYIYLYVYQVIREKIGRMYSKTLIVPISRGLWY